MEKPMRSLRTSSAMQHAAADYPDTRFRALLSLRLSQLDQGDSSDLGELVYIVVCETGDTLDALEATLGFTPLRNDTDGTSYGDPDFTPSWEWIKRHDGWFEIVWVLSDWGNGAILFVQDAQGVNPRLLGLCKESVSKTDS
jgi:hypothetical protein